MSMYSLKDIRDDIRDLLNEADTTALPDATLNSIINDTVLDMVIKSRCISSIVEVSTSALTRTVAADYVKVEAVELASKEKTLSRIEINEIGRSEYKSGLEPQFWFETGANIALDPIPNAVYDLNLYVSAYSDAEMTLDGDIPFSVPLEFLPLIIIGSVAAVLMKDRRFADAQEMFAMYENEIAFHRSDLVLSVEDSIEDVKYPYYSGRKQQ